MLILTSCLDGKDDDPGTSIASGQIVNAGAGASIARPDIRLWELDRRRWGKQSKRKSNNYR